MPEKIDTAELLSQVQIFNGLEDQDYLMLSEYFRIEKFRQGRVLFREGDRVKELSIIVSGSVEVLLPESGGEVHRFTEVKLATFGPGECFGEYSLLDLRPATATARIREDSELLRISGDELQKVLNRHCPIARTFYYNLLLLLIDRLRRQNQELDLFSLD
jgi:CRP-like cAMP-binding protein